MKKTVALILAGGQGKRMGALCYTRPKPLLPFAGELRVIDFTLSNCIHSGIEKIAVVVDHQRYSIAEYLRIWRSANAGSRCVDILEPKTGSFLGTADAVYQNLYYLRELGADKVLVLAADHVYNMDYQKMLTFHTRAQADVTVGAIGVPISEAHRFGVLAADATGRVVAFVEEPDAPTSNLVSMGIYVFDLDVLAKRLHENAAEPNSARDFGHAVIPLMVKQDRVFAYPFDGYWRDIGTIQAYHEANLDFVHHQPCLDLDSVRHVYTEEDERPMLSGVQQGTVVNSLVRPGCLIKGHVENSVLAPGTWVEEGAVIKNSVVMANTFVGYHSVVDSCVVDENVTIDKFCYIGFGPISGSEDPEPTVLAKDAEVPAFTALGRGCRVLPYTRAADFVANVIHPGAIVSPRARPLAAFCPSLPKDNSANG